MKKLTKSQKKQSSKRYVILSLVLVGILAASAYWNPSTSSGLESTVENFALNKNDISEAVGTIKTVQVHTGNGVSSNKNVIPVTAKITGSNQTANLSLNAMKSGSGWVFSNIRLSGPKGTMPLTPFYIKESSIYADNKDGPISENQKVFMEVFLNSTEEQALHSAPIVQTLTIMDENGGVVAHSDDIARFVPNKNEFYDGQGMRFTSSFTNLKSGRYKIKTTFRDKNGRILENFVKPVEVAPSDNKLAIRSVEYFDGQDLARKIRPEFNAAQNVYVRLNLNGFRSKDAAVAGQVDLEIKNSTGQLVATHPNFATFNELVDQQKSIVVDGKLQLKDPDIYQLSFKVKDANSNQMSVHNERILVTLP